MSLENIDNTELLTAKNIDKIIEVKEALKRDESVNFTIIKPNSPERSILSDCYHLGPNGSKKIIHGIEAFEEAFDAVPEDYN